MNNFEEYDDPELYDKENESYLPELPLLIKWASKKSGTIIDLACGTGRVTIPLAEKGFRVMGIDVHNGMLEKAQKKSTVAGVNIDWLQEDCTNLNLEMKSPLIYTVGNSFQHFLTNEAQDGLLVSVNRHLEEGGIFIFGTRFPGSEELLQPSTEEYWRTYQNGEYKVDVSTISHYDALEQIQHYTTIRKYKHVSDEIVDEKRTNISLRYVFPKEMERLLSVQGFEVLDVYEDWKETPVSNDSYEMIYVCRKMR
ncbi:class I SAM-dependent methyltransferase [Jeotgalibacillus haloalkalitolerans]|uniref:Class I SAM-dependent methyltransferase n=1 Tax=Jeotgalibacillus haloalkalitolerans TaxID=3104292 RepID=A0ABU5KHL0_9BACL|nr:class I SAM-dependent methyltransferase [Jeotgalibacillus sp. HH7-29]MDZ5710703.1 class I SAM-dependent methyltransferase [Jeotgalibacillus sp. HH7-29]